MSEPAAVLAAYVKLSTLVDGSVRVTLDIDPKSRAAAFALFDAPGASVAVARISNQAALAHDRRQQETPRGSAAGQGGGAAIEPAVAPPPAQDRKPMALASKIALTCRQTSFHAFLRRLDMDRWEHVDVPAGATEPDVERAAAWVRNECVATSRKDIVPGSPAAARWHTLEAEYEIWQRQRTGRAA